MSYAGTLTMPSNYVVMDEDEMMYLEGGRFTVYTDLVAWGIDMALICTGVNISAIGALTTMGLSKVAKTVWKKISAKTASFIGQTAASAIGSCISKMGMVAGVIVSATSLGGMIGLFIDSLDKKLNGKHVF